MMVIDNLRTFPLQSVTHSDLTTSAIGHGALWRVHYMRMVRAIVGRFSQSSATVKSILQSAY